jgi:uncharacterized membrane protein YoaK (UPF0700 family)
LQQRTVRQRRVDRPSRCAAWKLQRSHGGHWMSSKRISVGPSSKALATWVLLPNDSTVQVETLNGRPSWYARAMKRFDRYEWILTVGVAVLVGYVDAIGFLKSGGLFVSFMSGNSTQLGVNAAEGSVRAWFAAALIGAFVVGVVVGSLVGHFARAHRRPAVLGLVAILLATAAALGAPNQVEVAVAAMALAMGAINAVFEKVGGSSVGSVESAASTSTRSANGLFPREHWLSWGRNVVLWTSVVGGALIGAAVYLHLGAGGIWIASGASAVSALAAQLMRSRRAG